MSRVCVDTHVLVWYASAPKRLARRAARVLRRVDAGKLAVLIPAIVTVELTLLREAGRRALGVTELEALMAAQPAFQLLPIDLAHAKEFALLGSLRDPFDRLVVAAARVAGVPLVTADTDIHESGLVEVIWD